MAVTVFGGAGFIGSNLVDELMTQGFEVTVVDNLSEGKLDNLARWRNNPKFEFIRGDIRDRDLVRRACDHKSWVFHLAAMSRIQPSITDPHLAFEENCMGTINVLEGCRLGGVRRVVYSASSSAYGRGAAAEALINAGEGVTEDLPTDCLNPYSLSKKFGEEALDVYHKLYGLSTISLRYFNVYGPRHQESGSYATVIAIFRKQARDGVPLTVVGDGEQRRDFTFVGDVVRANMLAAMNQEATGTFNIGSGKNYSVNQVAELILGSKGGTIQHIEPRLGEARLTLADYRKAQEILGWKPLIDLATGITVLDKFENKSNLIVLA
jgi:UDP-glucose 4-epimerase